MRNKKSIAAIVIVLIVMTFILTGCFSIKSEIKKEIKSWEGINNISISSFSYHRAERMPLDDDKHGRYNIIIECDAFENLTPEEMKFAVETWDDYHSVFKNDKLHTFDIDLIQIVSNGKTYIIDTLYYSVELDGKTIVNGSSPSIPSSSESEKTATCNYCNGSGRVDGETCPWCNGSGKTYDNYFDDIIG